ncbi:hypothetical protein ACFXOD_34010 [Streptomyces sp. NPDC059161]|uniref:hypothetical protein n=1 Tax=Streptomyces sp. NPDC059161 TaxID=3346749 RepID=UPI0036B60FD4
MFDIDTAWARLVDARTRDDVQERTLALYALAQALYETGRHAEARRLDWDAYDLVKVSGSSCELSVTLFEMMTERGVYLAHSAGVAVAGHDHHGGASGNDPEPVVVTEEERGRLLDCAGTAFSRAQQATWGREDGPEAWKREADARLCRWPLPHAPHHPGARSNHPGQRRPHQPAVHHVRVRDPCGVCAVVGVLRGTRGKRRRVLSVLA